MENYYTIVVGHTTSDTVEKVNKKISEGYVPLGGISVTRL